MKLIAGASILTTSIFISYCLGYYNAVNDTAFLLHAKRAMASIGTINYLNKKEFSKIEKLNKTEAEGSMAAVEDISRLRGDFVKFPRKFIQYHSTFAMDSEFEHQTLDALRPKISRIVAH